MRATNPRTALAVTLLLPVLAAPARGQESPLAQVPADAALVVRLSGIEKAQGRLGKMIGNALPDMAPQINTQIEEALRSGPLQMLKDRDLSAVAKDRPVFLVFPTFEGLGEDPPGVVLLLPVSDPAAFRKGFFKAEPKKAEEGVEAYELEDLGQTVYVTDRKGYVAAAPGRAALKALKGEGLAGRLTPDVAETLSAADVAAYVNLRALNEAYGEQIQGFKQLMELGLQQGAPGVDEASAKMAKMFFDGLFQVLEDGQGFAVAFEFRPEGLNLRLLASFGSDTKTNNFLKGIKPDALAGLGGLPGGAMIYSAMRIDPSVFDALGGMMFNVLGNQEDEKVAEQMKRQLKALAEAGVTAQYSSAELTPVSGLEVTIAKDPAKAVAAEVAILKNIPEGGAYQTTPLKGKPVFEENAQTHRGFTLHHARVRFDIDKMVESQGPGVPDEFKDVMRAQFEKMFGKEIKIWFGTDGKVVLQATAPEWDEAKKLIDAYLDRKGGIGENAGFKLTRENLPREATVLSLIETGRFGLWFYDYIAGMMQAFPGMPFGPLPKLAQPKGDPSYIGFALVLKDRTGQVDVFVPTTAVQHIRTMVTPLTRPID